MDDLAGQVQMLEAAKVRLEMSMEQMRKENRRETNQRDEEMEEIRIAAQKKIKGMSFNAHFSKNYLPFIAIKLYIKCIACMILKEKY